MNFLKYIKPICLVLLTSFALTTSTICVDYAYAEPVSAPLATTQNSIYVTPLSVVKSPSFYLHKMVKMTAKFDKFSTLGLDYKSAFRSSDNYISFLIQRDDVSHNIPLSEMKLFLKREDAEKFIELKTDDKIQIVGYVFSDALGDPWIEVHQLTVLEKEADTKNNGEG